MTRLDRIRVSLEKGIADAQVTLEDESHLHAGHAGASTGRGHFRLSIVSPAFRGMNLISRHRAVYIALGDLMQTDIHALSIDARET